MRLDALSSVFIPEAVMPNPKNHSEAGGREVKMRWMWGGKYLNRFLFL